MEGKKGADVVALLASTLWGEDQCRPPLSGSRDPRAHTAYAARRAEPRAPKGSRNGNFIDGAWTAEALEERRWTTG